MDKISFDEYMAWSRGYYNNLYNSSLRYGQSFLNNFYPSIADDELFYSRDAKTATSIIMDRYIQF